MARDAIQSIDQQWNMAYQTNDHASLAHILADDWTAIDTRGKRVTKTAILDQVTHVPWPFTDAQFQTIRCWQGNDVAVVTGRLTGRGQVADQEVTVDQYYTRIYVVRDDRWQAVATQVTAVQPDV
jgi:ketosteroid isomerase-like protein